VTNADRESSRAKKLALQFERANEAFISYVRALSQEQWLTLVPGEERTVAALGHHVGWDYAFEISAFEVIAAAREPTPVTRAHLVDINAVNGAEYAEVLQPEVVALLRRNGEGASAFVRALSKEQLECRGRYLDHVPAMTVEQWIRRVLIGHIEMHARSIRKALGHDG
jgi:hypothetical protein